MSREHAPVYGNYHGYYNKRPAAQDQRLLLLPRTLFEDRRVLDVGCNEGWVTCEIAQSFGAHRVVGVDIDDSLVRAAWKRRRSVWSQQGPPHDRISGHEDSEDPSPSEARAKKRRRTESVDRDDGENADHGAGKPEHFPESCEHMFGPLPVPEASTEGGLDSGAFPHNVSFRTADWVKDSIPEDADGYDVVVAFSVSKWIHLNAGDEGLRAFFLRVHTVLRPGGKFVLEPQEWDTYGKAKRLAPRLKENAKGLVLRPDDFEEVLREIGFSSVEHIGPAGEGGFRRRIDVYTKL